MKTTTAIIILLSGFLCGQGYACAEEADKLSSFPGAEGFGRYTTGGRRGVVYHVTTLEDGNEKGTFRHAVNQRGARTIVFDVAGNIFLTSPLTIKRSDLTIAGQTAPGQGVCIAGYPVTIAADNVIVRYMRFRVGSDAPGEPDGLGGRGKKNIIIDHCSISWSVDECCSIYGNEYSTLQWCIVSESLRTAGHSKGAHGFGGNWGGDHASFHHNLLAHHMSRVPRLGPSASTQENEYMDLRNNVFYNWAGNGCYGGEGMKVNIVNNYYKPGPATPNNKVRYRIASISTRNKAYCYDKNGVPNKWFPMLHVWGKFYVGGNIMEGDEETTRDNWTKGIYEQVRKQDSDGTYTAATHDSIRLSAPLDPGFVTTHTAQETFEKVLAFAGCSKWRDRIDERIVKETATGTATFKGSISKDAARFPGLIDSPWDVKLKGEKSPWVKLSAGKVKAKDLKDTDNDGMPDWWEKKNGLNPEDAADGVKTTLSKEGYTNLEVYLNSLVNN